MAKTRLLQHFLKLSSIALPPALLMCTNPIDFGHCGSNTEEGLERSQLDPMLPPDFLSGMSMRPLVPVDGQRSAVPWKQPASSQSGRGAGSGERGARVGTGWHGRFAEYVPGGEHGQREYEQIEQIEHQCTRPSPRRHPCNADRVPTNSKEGRQALMTFSSLKSGRDCRVKQWTKCSRFF